MLKDGDLWLAPIGESDLPTLYRWINDRELVVLSSPFQPVHYSDHQDWFKGVSARDDTRIFAIRNGPGDRLIGMCQLTGMHPVHRHAELRIRIGDPENREKGYGMRAVRLLLKHAFKDLGLRRVYLYVFETNQRAVRTYAGAGFVEEGILRQDAYVDGVGVDVMIMGMLADEFDGSPVEGKNS